MKVVHFLFSHLSCQHIKNDGEKLRNDFNLFLVCLCNIIITDHIYPTKS